MIAFIGTLATADDASTLTVTDLINVGVPIGMIVTANLDDYKTAIAAVEATAVNTIDKIVQIIGTVNADNA
jgi:hypothetical protein